MTEKPVEVGRQDKPAKQKVTLNICLHLRPVMNIKIKGPYRGEASVRGYYCELIESGKRCDNYERRDSIPPTQPPLAHCIVGDLEDVVEVGKYEVKAT